MILSMTFGTLRKAYSSIGLAVGVSRGAWDVGGEDGLVKLMEERDRWKDKII